VLPAGSTARALRLASQEAPRTAPLPLPGARDLPAELKWTERPDIRKLLPPAIKILAPAENEPPAGGAVTVRVQVISQSAYPLKKPIQLRVANRPRGHAPMRQEYSRGSDETVWSQEVTVQPGEWISVIAENSAGAESVAVRGFARVPDTAAKNTPRNLYLLAIGVSDYAKLDPLHFAAQDAIDFAALYRDQQGRLFDQVHVQVLTNEQATRAGIREALRRLTEQPIQESDYVMLFVAGHGLIGVTNGRADDYYFAPFDGDRDHLDRTGISWDVLQNALKQLRAKVFLVLDTCHAGLVSSLGLDYKDTFNAVVRSEAEIGVVTFTACLPHEASQEKPELKNGVFTHALVEALRGAADSDNPPDREVSIREADFFVGKWVEKHTSGQHPQLGGTNTLKKALPLSRLSPSGAGTPPAGTSPAPATVTTTDAPGKPLP
jgi:hypothetical protein